MQGITRTAFIALVPIVAQQKITRHVAGLSSITGLVEGLCGTDSLYE
jgi:hypothetical protein